MISAHKCKHFSLYDCVVPFGHSQLQLSEQVLIEFVELWEVVKDLVEETLLNHRLPVLTRRVGHRATEVLRVR